MTRALVDLLKQNFIFLSFVALGLTAVGCKDRVFDFGGTVGPPDSGKPNDASIDSSLDRGTGGGGQTDGAAGTGGADARDATDGVNSETFISCRNDDPKRLTDIANCGTCLNLCRQPNAVPSCVAGVCTMGACLPDFYDRDPAAPGCETSCQKTNGGVEICDGLDNNCNGIVDD